jgi:hypothetical protein
MVPEWGKFVKQQRVLYIKGLTLDKASPFDKTLPLPTHCHGVSVIKPYRIYRIMSIPPEWYMPIFSLNYLLSERKC